jgi:tetratricopeptide (TPR) repeat protein
MNPIHSTSPPLALRFFLLLVLTFPALLLTAQSKRIRQQAEAYNQQGWHYLQRQNLDSAQIAFQASEQIFPNQARTTYSLAYILYLREQYPTSAQLLQQARTHKEPKPSVYLLLHDALQQQGLSDSAFAMLQIALKEFPNSGELYCEFADAQLRQGQYQQALMSYEKGMIQAPMCPCNYAKAAILLAKQTEEHLWAIIYGELYLNLEPLGQYAPQVSTLLFRAYNNSIIPRQTKADSTEYTLAIGRQGLYTLQDTANKRLYLTFEMSCWMALYKSARPIPPFWNLNDLDTVRTGMVRGWYAMGSHKAYANAWLARQQAIDQAGHASAYHHWLLSGGASNEFSLWMKAHEAQWQACWEWLQSNPLVLTAKNIPKRTANQEE